MARGLESYRYQEVIIGATYELSDRVAVITLDNPPVNGLGLETRRDLMAGLERANEDRDCDVIIITGAGKTFSGGADIREFGTPKALTEPTLHSLIRACEDSAKVVIAAINGTCMGGGLELSLGCHYRVAHAKAMLALPEVKLGLLPGAGGTQRLPRAVGVETALNMIVTGASTAAATLRDSGLLDALTDTNVVDAARVLAARIVAEKLPRKRLRDVAVEYPNAEAYFAFARNTVTAVARNFPAPRKCIEAVAGAVSMPFDEGLRNERRLFVELMQTPESRALRHAFFAERAASRVDGVSENTPARTIERVAVIGAGTMGAGIAMTFLSAQIPVTLIEMTHEALDKGARTIRSNYEASAKKGRITPEQVAANMARLEPSTEYARVHDADLIIEAVFEDMDIKQKLFATLDDAAKPGAILATNTSTLDVDRIAQATRRPQDVLGMHFFSPANVMKLLEVVRGRETTPEVLKSVMQLAKRIGKTAVVAGVCDGFIGNRMLEQYIRQAMLLLEEGASPAQVDRALENFGMAMGPFRMSDLAGNDVGWRIRKRRYVEKPHVAYSRVADRLCEQGRFGQKTGAGWYRYEAGRRDALPDPAVEALITSYRHEIGATARKIAPDEIVDRCILALVNEGARILDDGIAQRASDIDVVYLTGYGFPVHRGGPMLYADMQGLYNVMRRMHAFAAMPNADKAFWTPAPRLARLAAEGKTFNDA
ncbi:MAG: 3-hydroxyacyl-CoA dehydrogenase NAD-binding domain-containing protein [Pseudomonadota bacterium]|nr:3-hydroxyacyl-CoA dehydrogenase NAD-binding domain-containing protein [Pseudomonadota bacterium]